MQLKTLPRAKIRMTHSLPPIAQRLASLRQLLTTHHLAAYYIPSEDAHQSEYIAPCDARRQYISNFSGSAGFAVVTMKEAALWTDGRYFLQGERELDPELWTLMRMGVSGVPSKEEWLKKVPEK